MSAGSNPFPRGKNLHYLFRWNRRLRYRLEVESKPDSWDEIFFRPDQDERESIERLTKNHSDIIEQIEESLAQAERSYAGLVINPNDDAANESFNSDMRNLHDCLGSAVVALADRASIQVKCTKRDVSTIPENITNIADQEVRKRARIAWLATNDLLDSIEGYCRWLEIARKVPNWRVDEGDSFVNAGSTAIDTLCRLGMEDWSHDDATLFAQWPQPPSDYVTGAHADHSDRNLQDLLVSEVGFLKLIIRPEAQKQLRQLESAPEALFLGNATTDRVAPVKNKQKRKVRGRKPANWKRRRSDLDLVDDWERFNDQAGGRKTYIEFIQNRGLETSVHKLQLRIEQHYRWEKRLLARYEAKETAQTDKEFSEINCSGMATKDLKTILRRAIARRDASR